MISERVKQVRWTGDNQQEICDALSPTHRYLTVYHDVNHVLHLSFEKGARRVTRSLSIGDSYIYCVDEPERMAFKILDMITEGQERGISFSYAEVTREQWGQLLEEILLDASEIPIGEFYEIRRRGEIYVWGVKVVCPEIRDARHEHETARAVWNGDNLQEIVDTARRGFMVDSLNFRGSSIELGCVRYQWDSERTNDPLRYFLLQEGDEFVVNVAEEWRPA
jgi:hypothetical protein